jgi:predicted nucleotidyltransferase
LTNSIEAALRVVDNLVKPTVHDRKLFRLRADEVAGSLARHNASKQCRVVGSVARSTALRHYSDIDLLAVIERQHAQTANPQRAIATLGGALADVGLDVVTDDIAASVRFGQPPAVDVIPALSQSFEGGYLIPSGRDDQWQEFRPALLEELTSQSLRTLGPQFLTVVRLLKFWNVVRDVGFKSFELEELANVALGERGQIDSYSESLALTLGLCIDWVRGDFDAQSKMGRSFTSQLASQDFTRLQNSFALALKMSEPKDEREAAVLTKEFFGGEYAQHLR